MSGRTYQLLEAYQMSPAKIRSSASEMVNASKSQATRLDISITVTYYLPFL
jgi:hypothetical protein